VIDHTRLCNVSTVPLLLQISMCPKLREIDVRVGLLMKLDLSLLSICKLRVVAPCLQVLNLSGCFNLTDSSVQCNCPELSYLDLCGTSLNSIPFDEQADGKVHILCGDSTLNWA